MRAADAGFWSIVGFLASQTAGFQQNVKEAGIFISAGPLMLHLKARDTTFPSGTFTTIAFSIFSLVYLVSPPALYY